MSNVTTLPGVMPPPTGERNEALIASLKQLLSLAKEGKLQSFIGGGFTNDGMRVAVWADFEPDLYRMAGNIAMLQHEFVARRTVGVQE